MEAINRRVKMPGRAGEAKRAGKEPSPFVNQIEGAAFSFTS